MNANYTNKELDLDFWGVRLVRYVGHAATNLIDVTSSSIAAVACKPLVGQPRKASEIYENAEIVIGRVKVVEGLCAVSICEACYRFDLKDVLIETNKIRDKMLF